MTGLNYIPADKEKDLTVTWFYDDIPPEYRNFRIFAQAVEQEYQELRQLLAENEVRRHTQSSAAELRARRTYLKKRIVDLEKKFPWLVGEQFLEYALWGVPH